MSQSCDPWQEYRKRRNLVLFAFFGYVPVIFVIGLIISRFFHTITPIFVVAIMWMIFYGAVSIWFSSLRCPRCGKVFFSKWWYHNGFARRCVHCGLPKYASLPFRTDTPIATR
jgi:hypothetical protein